MNVLGLDPGKKNFAWAFVSEDEVLGHGLLPTITSLTDKHFDAQFDVFRSAVIGVLRSFKPHLVAVERMMHRPGLGGHGVVEYINVMIGIVLATAADHGRTCMPVAPATWKAHYQRTYGIPKGKFTMVTQKMSIKQPPGSKTKTKTELVEGVLGSREFTVHEGDAIGIACYGHHCCTGTNVLEVLRCKS